ncbi:hypothetical protein BKA70DRAFT_1433760 [Coprinopsis sp. MPI-PUGE-AT-0042]|nr:hypothetical protein BKA70DRAFT_1433760 [Coprinopsis sp. MPI-PUGE-AT-0042]
MSTRLTRSNISGSANVSADTRGGDERLQAGLHSQGHKASNARATSHAEGRTTQEGAARVDQQGPDDSSLEDALEQIRRLKIEVDWKRQQLGSKERENYKLKLQLLAAQEASKEEIRRRDMEILSKDEEIRSLKMETQDLERERDWYRVGTETLINNLDESKGITTHLLGCLTSALIEGCYSGCSIDALLAAEERSHPPETP